MKEGYLFSLDGIKKVKGNLGTKEPFPVFPFPCLSVFSQVYSGPNDETKDPFEEASENVSLNDWSDFLYSDKVIPEEALFLSGITKEIVSSESAI